MNFASFELKTIKFIKILKANFQQNIHPFVSIRDELSPESMLSLCHSLCEGLYQELHGP